jgi:hypothetical protein
MNLPDATVGMPKQPTKKLSLPLLLRARLSCDILSRYMRSVHRVCVCVLIVKLLCHTYRYTDVRFLSLDTYWPALVAESCSH